MDSFLDIDKNISIMGTDTGEVYRIASNQKEFIFQDEYNTEVRSIRKLKSTELVIAFLSGEIYFLNNYSEEYSITKVRTGNNSKYSRIYDLEILNDNVIYFSSNYGKIYKLARKNNTWEIEQIERFHGVNAIFCLDKLTENIFITCDYSGGVVIWEAKDEKEKILYQINTYGNIQCVTCSNDFNRLAMVHRMGKLLIFQKNDNKFELILEHETPKGSGKKIIYLENNDSFIFNTRYALYKYLNGNLYTSDLKFIGNIEKSQDKLYCLNLENEIKIIEDNSFIALDRIETLKLLNIGLIGHMGVGKSTLCDKFKDSTKPSDLSSTSHRKLWIEKVDENYFIFFNDIAGQLELIPTLIPSLKRSDIILALFKSNDSMTFDILEVYIDLLRVQYHFQNRIFLIRTFFNRNNLNSSHSDLINNNRIQALISKYNLEPMISIDRDDIDSLNQFKSKLIESINWDSSTEWKLSKQQRVFIDYMQFYLDKGLPIIKMTDICKIYDDLDDIRKRELNLLGFYGFDRSAVSSLILKYKDYNLIDVVRTQDDLILISNSPLFRRIKTKIYEYAINNMGFVNLDEIINYFLTTIDICEDKNFFLKYIEYYDKEFKNTNTWFENNKIQRIFWYLIRNEFFDGQPIIRRLREMQNGILEKITLDLKFRMSPSQKKEKLCNQELFIELLKIKLIAQKLSKTNGYWTNKENSINLYYSLIDDEESTIFSYYIFSDSESHNLALYIDSFFRFYFMNIDTLEDFI